MKHFRHFTLVELLVVIGIITILAGLIIPAVIGGAEQGRITQAKSDISSIIMACKQMETTYGKMVTKESVSSTVSKCFFIEKPQSSGKHNSGDPNIKVENGSIQFGDSSKSDTDISNVIYDAFIAELTNQTKVGTDKLWMNTNKRRIKFLEPQKGFDPSANYNSAENAPLLWRDPWGNRYVIRINVNGADEVYNPEDDSKASRRKLATNIVVYSFGPNGEDDHGRNVNQGGGKLEDDIASWHK